MSSDIPEGTTPGPGRRSGRADGGAPITGALAVVLAIVAVVAGFLILRSLSDNDSVSSGPSTGGTVTTPVTEPTDTTPITPIETTTTTTTPELVTEGATVVVANANTVNGSAGAMTRELEAAGYTMGDPTNAAASYGKPEATVIYFDDSVPAAQAVAESVGRSLGGVSGISPVAVPAPTESGELTGDVLVMLGNDKANKTLEDLQTAAGETTESSTAPAVSAPDPAGADTTAG